MTLKTSEIKTRAYNSWTLDTEHTTDDQENTTVDEQETDPDDSLGTDSILFAQPEAEPDHQGADDIHEESLEDD